MIITQQYTPPIHYSTALLAQHLYQLGSSVYFSFVGLVSMCVSRKIFPYPLAQPKQKNQTLPRGINIFIGRVSVHYNFLFLYIFTIDLDLVRQ